MLSFKDPVGNSCASDSDGTMILKVNQDHQNLQESAKLNGSHHHAEF